MVPETKELKEVKNAKEVKEAKEEKEEKFDINLETVWSPCCSGLFHLNCIRRQDSLAKKNVGFADHK